MKQLINFVMPLKIFAALMFAGLIGIYVVTAILHSIVTGDVMTSSISFVYLFQSVILSMLLSLFWSACFGQKIISRWRFFPRYILFATSMLIVLTISLFTFLALPNHWIKTLFLLALILFTGGVTIFLALNEYLHKKTGERYLNVLNEYQKKLPK